MFDIVDVSVLPAYALTVLFVCLAPGPEMAYLISVSIRHGRWAGVRAAAAAALATTLHVVVIAFGLAAVTHAHRGWLTGIHLAAAIYLGVVGVRMIKRARQPPLRSTDDRRMEDQAVFWPGFVNSVANVSSALFIAALIPEFVDPARGRLRLQILSLGLAFMVIAYVTETALGLLAAQAHAYAVRSSGVLAWLSRVSGVIICGLAVLSAWEGTSVIVG